MHKHLLLALCATLAIAPACRADGAYLGAGVGKSAQVTLNTPGASTTSDNGSPSFRLYGGAALSGNWALEGGYLHSSTDVGPAVAVRADTGYLAAKYTWALGESASLHGKAGVAYNRYRFSGTPGLDSADSVTPMLALGAEYKVAPQVSLTLEAANYGKTTDRGVRMMRRQVEAGIKFSF
jgi:opacity protein-like surface antigen